jgi:hypothetical protein
MPVYPKAPLHLSDDHSDVVNTYIDMLSRINSNDIFIMATAPGAAMAIRCASTLLRTTSLMPKENDNLQALAWTETLKNPDIALYEDRILSCQNILEVKILSYAGRRGKPHRLPRNSHIRTS